jgi:hypothetical protein
MYYSSSKKNIRTEFRSSVANTESNWKISLEILQSRDLQRIDQSGPGPGPKKFIGPTPDPEILGPDEL